jgi:type I restriction enzyme S subunit
MGEIPKNWSVKELDEVAEFQNGFAFYTVGYSEEGYKVVDLANVSSEGKFIETKRDKRIAPDVYNLPKHEKHHLNKDDIVMAMTDMTQAMGILGKCGKIYESNKFILNQRIGRLRVNEGMNVNFLLTNLNSRYQIDFLKNRALGTVQKYVNTSHIKEMEFVVPTNELMVHFGETVDPVFSSIRQNDVESDQLSELRDILLPKLLSGVLEISNEAQVT